MNQNQIQQLTSHLSQALDQNYDVVNMDAVLSVIRALEGTTITKEQLEATRLAKYINQLRRRTKNEHLARRAKSLLKKWREMVGIQQTPSDSLQPTASQQMQQTLQNTSDFFKLTSATATPDSFTETVTMLPVSQKLPSEINAYNNSSDPTTLTLPIPMPVHGNFSNLINDETHRKENNSIYQKEHHYQSQHPNEGLPQPQKMESSLNSILMSNTSDVGNEKISEVSVVIDIVSDSDDNDNISDCANIKRSCMNVPASPAIAPPTPSSRLKKPKKDKKNKEKERQIGQAMKTCKKAKDGFLQTPTLPADSEAFSLSNSSMSSILSGDVSLGNPQNKARANSSELTFTGRFKSLNPSEYGNHNSFCLLPVENNAFDKPTYDDYAYDSSASCSRLSPLTVDDHRKMDKLNNLIRHKNPKTFLSLSSASIAHDQSSKSEYLEPTNKGHAQKKRGRKKGSKGVDAVIAKESSSLSQQIFIGSSTVKKVKTTKELFNEIQSRKSSLSMQPSTNSFFMPGHAPRTTSPCSGKIIALKWVNSTHHALLNILKNITLEAPLTKGKSYTVCPENTDSVTSDPSHDSTKSQEIKECISMDSNSNTLHTLAFVNTSRNLKVENYNDITTQLMHLVNSLNNPLSVHEIEKLYEAQIVPCSCIVVQNVLNSLGGPENSITVSEKNDLQENSNYGENILEVSKKDKLNKFEQFNNNGEIDSQQKPVKSIFDLDFDDEDDPLYSIIDAIKKPLVSVNEINNSSASVLTNKDSMSLVDATIVDQLDNCNDQETNNEIPNMTQSIFTVHEDPDCLAKQRFYVRTNKVNNFHINALHNYYISNINGNWDDVDEYVSFKSMNDFLDTIDTFTVTDGADVVPKYGFLKYERIKKDLSWLKFLKPRKAKAFKSCLSPFLGIAKCLPMVRNSRFKSKTNPHKNISEEIMTNKFRSNPLIVDIDVTDSDRSDHNENKGPMRGHTNKLNPAFQDPFSNNLLKLVNDNDSCLKVKQDPTNENHRNRKTLRNEKARSKRHLCIGKRQIEENLPIKRLRINLNESILSGSISSDTDGTDIDDDNKLEYIKDQYAVVQRPMSDDKANSNHIVLTIKKTPSKINSPANSMSAVSPTTETDILKKSLPNSNLQDNYVALNQISSLSKRHRKPISSHYQHRQNYRTSDIGHSNTIDLELNHWFCLKSIPSISSKKKKYYQTLFFDDELCTENTIDQIEEIIDHSSNSSSYGGSYFEMKKQTAHFDEYNVETDISAAAALPESNIESDDSSPNYSPASIHDENNRAEINITASVEFNMDSDEIKAVENNGMLMSFNSIQSGHRHNDAERSDSLCERESLLTKAPLESLNNQICEDSHNLHNNNGNLIIGNFAANSKQNEKTQERVIDMNDSQYTGGSSNSIKFSCSGADHRVGIRPSSNNHGVGFANISYTRIQRFKEWHQVLQLKSYNDEPLIVMPYVVLE
ncbi:hypothetical protein KR018_000422 [Drosophila ironensis]|nr:hypothetical protein KR018_000422 [Drosophila ironensis]